ncbi:JmjC domain-containing protein [Streptomyces niveus]|uniref:JmjC domain-containing protein n=1 Tax=Streptomyces niveus TaxID=193462 RepID=UPI003412D119
MDLAHLPAAFEEQWIASLPLPVEDRPPGQTVALVDNDGFQREMNEEAIAGAYARRPRTRVLESIHSRSDGWYSLVALHLARLLRRRVVCTLYESQAGNDNLGRHHDQWDGLIMQMRGVKTWRLWGEQDTQQPLEQLLTRTGDVLLLPRGMSHEVETPDDSVHLVFAVTGEPLAATATQLPLSGPMTDRPGERIRSPSRPKPERSARGAW